MTVLLRLDCYSLILPGLALLFYFCGNHPPPPYFACVHANHYFPREAVCAGLGLLAHLDGSHVRLLAFSSWPGRGEQSDGASGGIVADIDLEAGRRTQNPDDTRGAGERSPRRDGAVDPALATTSQEPARGLSWGRCSHSAHDAVGAASVERGDSSGSGSGPHGGTGGGVGVRAVGGGRSGLEIGGGGGCGDFSFSSNCSSVSGDQGGEMACHIAVACGSGIRLWKVRRVSCGTRTGGSTEEGGTTNKQGVRYRYSTVSVLTDWHQTSDNGSSTDRKKISLPNGSIRCLSFRPYGGGSADDSANLSAAAGVVGGNGAVPLAAWYDAGAAVLG